MLPTSPSVVDPTRPRPVATWRRLATGGLSLLLAACAPMSPLLPSPAVAASTTVTPVAIEGAHGPVSAARARRMVENLKAEPGQPEGILDRHLAIESAITGSPLVADNAVALLQDGTATYRAMFEAIDRAKHHINMETYILQDDETGRRFADALIAKRQQGLQVNVLHDSVGTIDTPAAFFDRLKAAGIRVVEYNPINPLRAKSGWDINERDHRKLLVVDGETAFLGGINISAVYSSSGSAPKRRPAKPTPTPPPPPASAASASADSSNEGRPWRDTDVRIDGPVVAELQKIFLDTWAQQKGEPLNLADYLPARRQARGRHVVRAIASSPDDAYSTIYATLLSSINHAEKEILITMAYFVPDERLIDALSRAARRGVDVRLILPHHSDTKLVLSAGRAQYGPLLESGVKLYERRTVLLHAKSAVIDGVWSTVGSANLDWRSFVHNQELNAVVLGDEFGAQMQKAFARDLAQSDPVTLEAWNRRPLGERVRGWVGQLLQYWL